MLKETKVTFIVLTVFLAFLFCVEFSITRLGFSIFPRYPYYEVAALARQLDAKPEGRWTFPRSYFAEVIEEGQSMEEVHEIIRGYEAVYRCGQSEIYYYYSTNRYHALRFMVVYENGDYAGVFGEDWNSQPFDVSLCGEGRIRE